MSMFVQLHELSGPCWFLVKWPAFEVPLGKRTTNKGKHTLPIGPQEGCYEIFAIILVPRGFKARYVQAVHLRSQQRYTFPGSVSVLPIDDNMVFGNLSVFSSRVLQTQVARMRRRRVRKEAREARHF
ncbi:MAG: hypothetical protein HYS59_02330 [Candidatus Vogelbacteria bacterium]|nr:hypothetical protein [Candidatus Vogelbacteria bacterium]